MPGGSGLSRRRRRARLHTELLQWPCAAPMRVVARAYAPEPVRAAAGRVVVLWPAQRSGPPSGAAGHGEGIAISRSRPDRPCALGRPPTVHSDPGRRPDGRSGRRHPPQLVARSGEALLVAGDHGRVPPGGTRHADPGSPRPPASSDGLEQAFWSCQAAGARTEDRRPHAGAGPVRVVGDGGGGPGPYRPKTPARDSVLMLPARGRVARLAAPRVTSAVCGSGVRKSRAVPLR